MLKRWLAHDISCCCRLSPAARAVPFPALDATSCSLEQAPHMVCPLSAGMACTCFASHPACYQLMCMLLEGIKLSHVCCMSVGV